jgi:2,3-bisphosphoglycerate-independent phosphoglycerate mutase
MSIETKMQAVALVIFDGLGYSLSRQVTLASAIIQQLSPDTMAEVRQALEAPCSEAGIELAQAMEWLMFPNHAETVSGGTSTADALAHIDLLSHAQALLSEDAIAEIAEVRRSIAEEARYVPWVADTPHLTSARNGNLTFPTHASGRLVGFEDLDPAVMGNSDTGHQQIGNIWVAPQTALEISAAISSGQFIANPQLNEAIERVSSSGNLNFRFLLSGTIGADGRVHSAWNHLEAFLELAFVRHHIPPARMRMEVILDGRDSPADSSTTRNQNGVGDYLGQLETLLERYDAQGCVAWVVGRNIAMDRDFREENTARTYQMLLAGEGEVIRDLIALRERIDDFHAQDRSDTEIPPMVVPAPDGSVRVIESGDTFINLNFRADRQRAISAALLGDRNFLTKEAAERNRAWNFDWLRDDLKIHLTGLAEYHPELERSGMTVAFPTGPQPGNIFALFPSLFSGETYSLVGESNKSAHVGYFLRGRRETPSNQGFETRDVFPSTSEADGVESDADFWKTPGMRAPEISTEMAHQIRSSQHRVLACNFSNCDMIGHLLPGQFDAAVEAYEAVDAAVGAILAAATEVGCDVILTSDHGNIEENNPAHSANQILTTVNANRSSIVADSEGLFEARLFDIPWTIAALSGVERELGALSLSIPGRPTDPQVIGKPLVRVST